jgi:hypothetical protein
VVGFGALALSGGQAAGGPPGSWTRVTDTGLGNIDQLAVARGTDGVLNVVWPHKVGSLREYRAARIAPNGRVVGATSTVVEGWATLNNPTLVVEPGGSLRLIFAGLHKTRPEFASGRATSATAPPDGSSWTWSEAFHTDAVSINESSASFGGAVKLDGTPVFSWGATVKVGLDPTVEQTLMDGCCKYDSDVAVDARTGQVVVAWYSNVRDQYGTLARVVDPTLGPILYGPNSARPGRKQARDNGQRVAVTSRIGATGVYVAYPSWAGRRVTGAHLWRVGVAGAGATVPVTTETALGRPLHLALSPGPEGRIWVAWRGAGNRVYARRSNRAGTELGPEVSASPPPGTTTLWKLAGDGTTGPLDVIANVTAGGTIAGWHTQLLPALSLAYDGRVDLFRVFDAGDPVPGARVRVGGRTRTTDAAGRAAIDLPAGKHAATAGKAGYADATLRVTVLGESRP